ncbi:MAG: hypothetical protein IJA97_05830 [Clostridia bacterium]|nr:hypothetical protein [Clostridia bacterium]
MRKLLLTILACACAFTLMIGLTGCKGLELGDPTNIRYDGSSITWDSVQDANQYKVSINGGDEYTVNTNRYAFRANGAEFTVTIKATHKSEKVKEEGEATKTFKPLAKIQEVRIDATGNISWDAVDGATAYKVKDNGSELPNEFYETEYTNLPAGHHNIAVKAIVSGDTSYYSEWSQSKQLDILGQVNKDQIVYSNTTASINWNSVAGATGYEVRVNGVVLAENHSGTSFAYDSNALNFSVEIKAVGNGVTTFSGALSEKKDFVYLPTVTNVTVVDGVLVWNEVSGASGYKIKIGNNVKNETLSTNSYPNLTANVSTEVCIMPVSTDSTYFSSWSTPKTVLILPTPVLQWNDSLEHEGQEMKSIYWDLIQNAGGYKVKVTTPDGNSTERNLARDEDGYAHAYLDEGDYMVQLKAITSDANTYESKYSDPIYITRLAAPVQNDEDFITSDAADVSKGFTVTFKTVAGASGYKLYRDNAEYKTGLATQFSVTDVVANSVIEEQSYNFAIQAVGNVSRNGGITRVNLSSLKTKSLTFGIKVLAQPATPTIEGFEYKYGTINGANGYSISIDGEKATSGNTSYDLSILEAGSYDVRVCAKGNGSDVLASNYTGAINVQRLEAPRNVRINTADASEGVLGWDPVLHALSYLVVFDGDSGLGSVPAEDIQNMNQYITTEGTTVHMETVANYFNTDKTVYYMSSKAGLTTKFVKLAAPTFGDVAFNNNQLIWNAPRNINAQKYTPTYEVYYPNGTLYNGEKNGTTMDISSLVGGNSYTFLVKAIGNGTEYINSEKSTEVTVYKLETPEVRRETGKYVWDGIALASSYVIYVDGVVAETYTHVSGESYSYTPKFNRVKDYTVVVIAIGDGGYTTINSDENKFVQKTKQLTTPDFKLSYSAESYSETGEIIATITKESEHNNGYSYTIAGVEQTVKASTCNHNPGAVGKHFARVYALGGAFDDEGIYYLDSQSAGGNNTSYYITLLAVPNESSFTWREGIITWATITDAVQYEVEFSINGGEFTSPVVAVQPQINAKNAQTIVDWKTANEGVAITNIIIRVRAIGNGNKIISSTTVTKEYNNITL